jgi:hypothetical protein
MNKEQHNIYWKEYQDQLNAEKNLETLDTIIAAILGSALALIGLYVLPIILAIAVGL